MQQVTMNDVRYAVIAVLEAAFPDIPVLGEEAAHNETPPYFRTKLLETGHTRELGRRYRRDHHVVVQYWAAGQDVADSYATADRLTDVLEEIEIGGRPVSGAGMRFELDGGVLHFFVDYKMLVWRSRQEAPAMQELKQEGSIIE